MKPPISKPVTKPAPPSHHAFLAALRIARKAEIQRIQNSLRDLRDHDHRPDKDAAWYAIIDGLQALTHIQPE